MPPRWKRLPGASGRKRPINRSIAQGAGAGVPGKGAKKPKSNPVLTISFDGLNHREQRLANGGNQFSTEPPDQGLCVGNGYVLEAVNSVIRVFDTAGNALTGHRSQLVLRLAGAVPAAADGIPVLGQAVELFQARAP